MAKWKYLIIIIAITLGIIYTIPNFYGEAPAVQVSNKNSVSTIDNKTLEIINAKLLSLDIKTLQESFDGKALKLKFANIDTQLKAREVIEEALGENYVVALNLISNTPQWLDKINAKAMFLGLDLRGGVHFLFTIDINAAIKKTLDKSISDIKRILRKENIRYGTVESQQNAITVQFRDNTLTHDALKVLQKNLSNMQLKIVNNTVFLSLQAQQIKTIKEDAVKQNIIILRNRINELGVAEPIIQQQGQTQIVVELPGVQDTARAKDILGRTASLEVRLVNDESRDGEILDYNQEKIALNRDVELTGDNINDAQPSFDENGSPSVNIKLDNVGAAIFKQITSENIGRRLAMVLVDNDKSQVVTAPVIKSAIGGGRVEISGAMNTTQANDTALLLRSGSLAAPMTIIEERTIGPSLGQENIVKGFHSVLWGFLAISVFMIIYYMAFGMISIVSLTVNLLLLIASLSMLQATLTLPGIAAIALALGMAIDSNVLINERIREELRLGKKIHNAINSGYSHAWATILDSNVTTLIAGLALLAFGSGPIKGFAVVHCLGILTSMFSAVIVSKSIVTILYLNRNIKKLYI